MAKVFLLFPLLCLSGCATIVNGGKKDLLFYSEEENSTIIVEDVKNDEVLMKQDKVRYTAKNGKLRVRATKEGCESTIVTVDSKFSLGWYIFGNMFSFSYLGWIFDPMFGGMWYYDSKEYEVTPYCGGVKKQDNNLVQKNIAKKKSKKVEHEAVEKPEEKGEKNPEPLSSIFVAVLETRARNEILDLESRLYMTDMLRQYANKILPSEKGFSIMTRDNIQVMLPPEKSIDECEGSCLAETGRNIAADYVAQARVGKFKSLFTVTIEMYDSKSGNLIGSFTARAENEENLLLEVEKGAEGFFEPVLRLSGR